MWKRFLIVRMVKRLELKEVYKRLYKRLPNMKCKEGCTDCCGPVPFSKWESDNAKVDFDFVPGKTMFTEIHCKHICDGKCSIYENRPFMCRLYGTTEKLKCPHGIFPEYQITDELSEELTEQYIKLIKSEQN